MSKSKYFTGQPIFTQLLSYVPQYHVKSIAEDHKADRYYKDFKTYTHLVTMLYGIFNRCTALREVTTGMLAWEHRIQHLGINYHPRRSTISDANSSRPAEVFESIYYWLYHRNREFLPDSRSKKAARLYIADSTTIQLFQEVLKNAGRNPVEGRRKGGIKVHTLIKADEDVPCLIRFSPGAAADSPFLKNIRLPEGSVLVFDKGYNDYKQYNRLTNEKVTWVSRLKSNAIVTVEEKKPISDSEKAKGIIKDQLIDMGHNIHKTNPHVKARLIKYKNPHTKQIFHFITNNRRFNPSTIADFYKSVGRLNLFLKG